MAVPRFEIRVNRKFLVGKQRFHVVLIGLNGKILSDTENFKTEDSALNNIAAQREAAPGAVIEKIDGVFEEAWKDAAPKPKLKES